VTLAAYRPEAKAGIALPAHFVAKSVERAISSYTGEDFRLS
jgi:hypothetical protein